MATSQIILYSTQIDPARNMVVEELDSYLANCPSTSTYEIMYVKPNLETNVNLPWPQSIGWVPSNSTYAKIITDSKPYYYFVTKVEWRAENVVGLTLALDTINTYWNDYRTQFTNRTHITRQHKNRFLKNGAREIDEFDEGITPVLQYSGHNVIGANTPLWYLVYKTNTEQTNSTVSCYCCANNRILRSSQSAAAEQTLTTADFIRDVWYYLIADSDCLTPGISVGGSTYTVGSNGVIIIRFRAIGTTGSFQIYTTDDHGNIINNTTANSITFRNTRRVYYDTTVTTPSGYTSQLSNIRAMATRTLLSGTVGALYLEPISKVDRTDPLLIKVIELGYSPFMVQYNNSGEIQVPTGWEYDYLTGMFRLTNLDTEFLNPEIGVYDTGNVEYALNFTVNVNAVPNIYYESKLYNSNFYGLKFAYDTESYVVKPERIRTYSGLNYSSYPRFTISYKPSNGINSNCAFKFTHEQGGMVTSTYHDGLDYEGILVSTRNNELPLYNNEYLNYLKYGKQYADRQTGLNVGATWLNTLLSIGGGVAAGAIVGSAPGAIVGGIIGAVSGISTAITSTVKAIDSQQQKEWELQHQATNVTGNSDLDLFKWYSDGKLHVFRREPTSKMKNLLFTLFFRGGYACDDYGIPNLNSRYWFNFLQCTPSFNSLPIYQPFIDDIKKRYEAGVTIFHHHGNEWNLNYTKENWETSLVGVFDINQLIVNYTTTATAYLIFTPTWNGPALSASQHIKFSAYATENDWINRIPTSTQNVTSGVAFRYTSATPYMVTFQIVDDNDVNKNSAIQALTKSDLTRTYYRSSTISNLYISDAGMIGCRTQGQSIRAADYLEFEYYRNNNGFAPTPDVTARIYGPYSSSTHTPATAIPPGDYNSYTGSILRCRIVCTSNPTDTSSWNTVTIGG